MEGIPYQKYPVALKKEVDEYKFSFTERLIKAENILREIVEKKGKVSAKKYNKLKSYIILLEDTLASYKPAFKPTDFRELDKRIDRRDVDWFRNKLNSLRKEAIELKFLPEVRVYPPPDKVIEARYGL